MAASTPAKAKRRYGLIRRRYFMGANADGGLPVPTAKDLTWVWAAEGADILGCTVFDEDNHPFELHLNSLLLRHGLAWELDRVLAHEMTHLRLGPGRSCSARKYAPYWLMEQKRLTELGVRWL